MLRGAFTFGGRMGRLNYAVNALLLTVTLALLAIAGFAAAFMLAGSLALLALAAFAALVVLPLVLWVGLALLTRRVRDIGWEPRVVLPGWLLLPLVDRAVAGHATVVGAGLALAFVIALFIMPGADAAAPSDQAAGVPPG